MNKVLPSFTWALPLALSLSHCANLQCPSGQELGGSFCVCSSTLEPPVNGTCVEDACGPDGCPCTREGIEAAIARGGMQVLQCGADAQPINTTETIVIDNDVTLDGQGNLTVQGNFDFQPMFDVQAFEVELIGFTITRGDQAIAVSTDATLTLTNSVVKENTSSSAGGGIRNDGVLTLVSTSVEGNIANDGPGGGIFNTGTLTLTNSTVVGNKSDIGRGGGIHNDRGTVVVKDGSEISGNIASAGNGGGISNVSTGLSDGDGTFDVTVTNSSILGNTASANGGGISNEDGTVTVIGSTIDGNIARGAGGGLATRGVFATMQITDTAVSLNRSTGVGGGIWSQRGTQTATRTTWSGNESEFDGGAILIEGNGTMFTLISSTVSGNGAAVVGGAVRVYNNANATILNSTIFDNFAGDGGALHIQLGASAELRSSTISRNRASGINGNAAGITNIDGTLTLIQTIIDDSCVALATTVSLDYNIESPGNTCQLDGTNDMVDVTPEALALSGTLTENVGATPTLMMTSQSVAVDSMISSCDQMEDQRGVSRPQGLGCDIGAVELRPDE